MYRITDANGRTKYSGRSKALVIDNRDPLNRGRIQVDHPLLGPTIWIDYLRIPGHFSVPSIGDLVYVECDAGVAEFPLAWGNVTKGEEANPEIPEEFKRDIPTNRGLYSPGGHQIEIDDGVAEIVQAPDDTQFTTENRGIRITSTAGNKIHISEDPEGEKEFILIESINGSKIEINSKDNKISITDTDNSIEIDKNANTITSTNSQGKIFKLDDKQILGRGTEPLVLGDTLFDMLDTFLNSVISGIVPGDPGSNAASLTAIKQAATTLQSSLPDFKSENSTTD